MNTVLFDLDGTLLPLNEQKFLQIYFAGLTKKADAFGYTPEDIVKAVWQGTRAMQQNDGSATNEALFWQTFAGLLGEDVLALKDEFEAYYQKEFHAVRGAARPTPLAAQCICRLKAKGYRVAVATNPLFPRVAVLSRLGWAGLDPADFELITSYEDSFFCKPAAGYYQGILNRLGTDASHCLMVGNDVREDMCAATLGMEIYLITDCLLNPDGADISVYRQGSFADFAAFVDALPAAGTLS